MIQIQVYIISMSWRVTVLKI